MLASLEKKGGKRAINEPSNSTTKLPQFDFTEYFRGHTRASGWFSDRFGKPRRHFCGDFYGFFEKDEFILDEKLFYTDDIVEVRQWKVNVTGNGIFSAKSDSLINGAHGFVDGNRLSMRYSMKVKIEQDKEWGLDMKDLMILQPDGSLHNITQVCKWGCRIGIVSTHFTKHEGDRLCAVESSNSQGRLRGENTGRHLSSVGS
ncbi:MAG: DUF3833 family protein [Granulosicoccus sp.]